MIAGAKLFRIACRLRNFWRCDCDPGAVPLWTSEVFFGANTRSTMFKRRRDGRFSSVTSPRAPGPLPHPPPSSSPKRLANGAAARLSKLPFSHLVFSHLPDEWGSDRPFDNPPPSSLSATFHALQNPSSRSSNTFVNAPPLRQSASSPTPTCATSHASIPS